MLHECRFMETGLFLLQLRIVGLDVLVGDTAITELVWLVHQGGLPRSAADTMNPIVKLRSDF